MDEELCAPKGWGGLAAGAEDAGPPAAHGVEGRLSRARPHGGRPGPAESIAGIAHWHEGNAALFFGTFRGKL